MRGIQPLIALRMRKMRPTMVSVDIGAPGDTWLYDNWHKQGLQAFLLIEPADPVDRLDLRCLVGLLVHLSGPEDQADRVRRAYAAIQRAGADRVLGSIHRLQNGSLETVEHLDTTGVLTWLE